MLIAIVGATGTGKSDLSIALAEQMDGDVEIVNSDAMQLYRGMDIGTAKVPEHERAGIPHHMLDVLEPSEEASVADYQRDARAAIEAIEARGAVPLLVGGSGLYVSSVIQDFQFPGTDPAVRTRLEQELDELGTAELHRRLTELDPVAATGIGPHNGRRLVRALEVIELTGEPFGAGLPEHRPPWRDSVILGLRTDRDQLVARLDARAARMWDQGLLDEVAALRPGGLGVTASRAIGYAQALAQLDGELEAAEAISQTASLTRRLARRQVGWFGRPGFNGAKATWLDADDPILVQSALEALRNPAG